MTIGKDYDLRAGVRMKLNPSTKLRGYKVLKARSYRNPTD